MITNETNQLLQDAVTIFLASKPYANKVGLCVIDCTSGQAPLVASYNDMVFGYPASVYKLFVAAALIKQVAQGKINLGTLVIVSKVNAIDTEKEIPFDPRPLLSAGQKVTIQYLLDLMITRSDNTAANCLIDLVTRPVINRFIRASGWRGSEVTRKFLPRAIEDRYYKKAKPTVSCARHFAELLLKIEQGKIGNPDLSAHLKVLLGKQLDQTKIRKGLPKSTQFFHKTGWWNKTKKEGFTADCGIVEFKKQRYIIACLTSLPTPQGNRVLAEIGREVYSFMVTPRT